MTDQDIIKLASKLTQSLATKDDIKNVKDDIKKLEVKLEDRIYKLDEKIDSILKYVENIDDATFDQEKRLKRIEAIPAVALGI